MMEEVNSKGFPAVLFNSQKYFWSKKTPEQTASDVEKVINYYQSQWKVKNVIIIGYSFGADVAPFIVTRLSKNSYNSVKNIVLMSPSQATDFEVHVAQLFGHGKSTGSSVTAEINKIKQKPLLIIQGLKESEKIESTSLKVTYKLIGLKGGHRYESDTSEVANTIFKNLQ
jgi:type IV secretory pathway VirJ component